MNTTYLLVFECPDCGHVWSLAREPNPDTLDECDQCASEVTPSKCYEEVT